MTLQDAIEHQRIIGLYLHQLNQAVGTATDAGLSVELTIIEISSLSHCDEQRVAASVTVDPSTLE